MLAIVIPYFKIDYFEECLESLSNQTNKEFNVYIGNDNSPNDPTSLIQKYSDKIHITYVKFDENLGKDSLTSQWDRCISLIKDEKWIMILGDDDFISPNLIESWYLNFKTFHNKSNVIRFSSYEVNEILKEQGIHCYHPKWEQATEAFWRKCIYTSRSSLTEYVFSKDSYRKSGFYDYDLAWSSDDRAWLEFSEHKPIYSINESYAVIRTSEESITGQQSNNFRKSQVKIEFYKFLLSTYITSYNKNQLLLFNGRLENLIRGSRRLTFKEWFFIFKIYLLCFHINELTKFFKRSINSILNRPIS